MTESFICVVNQGHEIKLSAMELYKTVMEEKAKTVSGDEEEDQIRLVTELFESTLSEFEKEIKTLAKFSGDVCHGLTKALRELHKTHEKTDGVYELAKKFGSCLRDFAEFIQVEDYLTQSIGIFKALVAFKGSPAAHIGLGVSELSLAKSQANQLSSSMAFSGEEDLSEDVVGLAAIISTLDKLLPELKIHFKAVPTVKESLDISSVFFHLFMALKTLSVPSDKTTPLLMSAVDVLKSFSRDIASDAAALELEGTVYFHLAECQVKDSSAASSPKSKSRNSSSSNIHSPKSTLEKSLQRLEKAQTILHSTIGSSVFSLEYSLAQAYLLASVLVPEDNDDDVLELVDKAVKCFGTCLEIEPENEEVRRQMTDLGAGVDGGEGEEGDAEE